ncbi:Uma2 family endonuclease [Streptomyces violascens]|uniref:Uma2 family endonuclease n=1 Tax=Streptomyces violascens TaxID=67381 RepID=UPI00368E4DDB
MSVANFEELARHAPETATLEFINGKPTAKPLPDGDHVTIFMWLLRQCMRHRPDLDLHPEQGLKVGAYRNGRARPDGSLGPVGHFAGLSEWADPSGVLMTVEITPHDSGTDRCDRVEKRDGYAQANIPVYLLIDRDTNALVVHSNPQHGRYTQTTSHPYRATVQLPDPVNITLETEKLKDYAL